MTAQEIAAALGPYSVKPGGGFMACCPAHDDKNPSLAIDESNGAFLVKCFAGCEQGAVVDAFKARDLWPGNGSTLPPARKAVTAPIWKPVLPVPSDAPEPPATSYDNRKPSHVWRYLSAGGDLLHLVYRFDKSGGKDFLPMVYASNGKRQEWRFQGISDNLPLYGLELIGDAKHIVIVEGEKTADAARRLLGKALPVVTWSGGSNATNKTDFSPLAGKTVAIWPDADQAGAKAALAIADHLTAIGCTVKIVVPPADVLKGWDLADAEAEGWDAERVKAHLQENARTVAEFAPPEPPRFKLLSAADLKKQPPLNWIVKGLLPSRGIGYVFGPSMSGKSFLTFDLGAAVADPDCDDWFDHRISNHRHVVYIALEGQHAVRQRAEAMERHTGKPLPDDLHIILDPLRITDPLQVADLAAVCPTGALVIIDTQNCAAPGADENSSKDMGLIIEGAKQLEKLVEGFVMLVAHTGKDTSKGPRGHSSQVPAADLVIEVCRDADRREWTAKKVKDGPDGTRHAFALKVIELGRDADGDTITSCVLDKDVVAQQKRDALNAGERLALTTLRNLCEAGGQVHIDAWRDEFYGKHTGDSVASKRQAFLRARQRLTERSLIRVDNDFYMPAGSVTSVTERDKTQNVTPKYRDNRDNTLRGVTYVTQKGIEADVEDQEVLQWEL